MSHRTLASAAFAAALGMAGLAQAQTATTTGPAATPQTTTSTPATAPTAMTPNTNTSNAPVVSGTNSATNNSVNTQPQNNSGAPVAGANSFTEGQARDRIQDKGYTQVTDLKLDSQGIWRGKATRNGQSTDVSVDYQGNVVPQ